MVLSPLTAVSPVDGRYHRSTAVLGDYFSESALMKYRVRVEIEYFIALCAIPLPPLKPLAPETTASLRAACQNFSTKTATTM